MYAKYTTDEKELKEFHREIYGRDQVAAVVFSGSFCCSFSQKFILKVASLLHFSGYVQGERGEIPVAIDFMHGFEKGTQLVVVRNPFVYSLLFMLI